MNYTDAHYDEAQEQKSLRDHSDAGYWKRVGQTRVDVDELPDLADVVDL